MQSKAAGHSIDLDYVAAHPIGALPAYADLAESWKRRGLFRPLFRRLKYQKVSTIAPFLLDCSGLLPIPGRLIGLSRRRRRGSGVRGFGAKETQPLFPVSQFRETNHSVDSLRSAARRQ